MPYIRYDRSSYIGIGASGHNRGKMILVEAPTKAKQFSEEQVEMMMLVLDFIGEPNANMIDDALMDEVMKVHRDKIAQRRRQRIKEDNIGLTSLSG